jgi:tryptophan-rich sensory protein
MDANLNVALTLAALAASLTALFFSSLAAFPGLKSVLAAVRDGVLWFALFLILGASSFVVWQHLEKGRTKGQALTGTVVSTEADDQPAGSPGFAR